MSRVNFGAKPLMYPQPVLIIGTYDESVVTDGAVDITKVKPISFDPFGNAYFGVGAKVGNAFKDGMTLTISGISIR